jgi:hypothetical protein
LIYGIFGIQSSFTFLNLVIMESNRQSVNDGPFMFCKHCGYANVPSATSCVSCQEFGDMLVLGNSSNKPAGVPNYNPMMTVAFSDRVRALLNAKK